MAAAEVAWHYKLDPHEVEKWSYNDILLHKQVAVFMKEREFTRLETSLGIRWTAEAMRADEEATRGAPPTEISIPLALALNPSIAEHARHILGEAARRRKQAQLRDDEQVTEIGELTDEQALALLKSAAKQGGDPMAIAAQRAKASK